MLAKWWWCGCAPALLLLFANSVQRQRNFGVRTSVLSKKRVAYFFEEEGIHQRRKQRRKPLFQAVTAYFGVSSSVLGFRQASCLANTLNVVDMLQPPVKMLISHILNIVHICDIRHQHRTLLVLLALQLLLPSISQANLPGEFVYQNFFIGPLI